MHVPVRQTFATFFGARGTHLAAMVAYFALASIVPLVFLALALLGLFGRVDESSALVHYLEDLLPARPVDDIVNAVGAVQRNARTLGIVGGVFLLWSSLSLFSALESAFNVVYGRPNRPFLRGKALALAYMTISLLVLFVGLVVGTIGYDLLRRYASDVFSNRWVALALAIATSALALFSFLFSAYYRLTNARLTRREVIPGAVLGAVVARRHAPGPAAVREHVRRAAGPAGARRDLPAPDLALRDGERDRLRRSVQLAARLRRDGPRGRGQAS